MKCSIEKNGSSDSRRYCKRNKHNANVKILLKIIKTKNKHKKQENTENKQKIIHERDAQSTKRAKYERGNAMSTTLKKQAKSTNERANKKRMTNKQQCKQQKRKANPKLETKKRY